MSKAASARHAMNVENFAILVKFCAAMEPTRYHPIRLNLKIGALKEALSVAEASLASVEQTHADLAKLHEVGADAALLEAQRLAHLAHEKAKEARNAALYAPGEGIVDLANDCKTYLKTLKGPHEADWHHITHLEFRGQA